MANPFDQFDAGPSPSPAARSGNPFDRFDAGLVSGGPAGGDPGALQLRVGARPFPEPGPSFDDRYGSGPMASTAETSTPLGAGMRAKADEALVGKPDGTTPYLAALYRAGNTAGLNIPRNVAAGIATGLGAAGVPGYGNRSFTENYDRSRDQEEAFARQAPKAALAGTVGGVILGAGALPAIPAAEGAAIGGRAAAAGLTGALYGGISEGLDEKTPFAVGKGAAIGGVAGGVGGLIIEKAAPIVLGFLRKGVPFRDASGQLTEPAFNALREAGIDPAQITPELEQHLVTAFSAKGPSPAAAREALAAEHGIALSRGQATGDPQAVRTEGMALTGQSGGRAQEIGQGFETQQAGQIDAARGRLQATAARGAPLIDNPRVAFEAAADRARMTDDAVTARAGAAQRVQDDALRAVQGAAPLDALDGATVAVQGARQAAERSKGAYRQAYGEVAEIPGTFAPGALDDVGNRVRRALGPEIPLDDVNTPAAARALADLDNLPGILGLREGETPTLQQSEQIRKRFSRYYPGTAQNPTDRAALNAVREAYDQRIEDLLSIGRFGERPPAARAVEAFPGDVSASPLDAIPMPETPRGSPEPMGRYIARNGGIAMTEDARAADLHRAYYPGAGSLARHDGIPLDQWRVKLVEAGYLHPEETGGASARDVSDLIMDGLRAERTGAGQPRYRVADEARIGGQRAVDRVSDQNADDAAMIDRQARRMAIDLEGYGYTARDLDKEALRDAAEAMVRGETDDAASAYERAVLRQEGARPSAPAGNPAPFPEPGEGFSPMSSAFPVGDTAPADAMRKARGLFREHKQAFAPRGPGDVAGQRLQKIVERDASPNEAVSMLFGTTTGRVSSGQLQTLDRLRSAVGEGSAPWQAVQQAIVGRYVGGDGRGLRQRLDYLLRGEGRDLAARFLSPEQRTGLGQLRAAVAATERAHEPPPPWVQSLARHGFDPNAIASSLFGSGVPGARVGALNEARAAKAFLGEASPEWSGLRQAAVQMLTEPTMKAGKIVERVRAFTDGPGAGVAREMFGPEELGQFRRFAAALQTTIRPDGAMKPGSQAAAGVVAKAIDVLAGMVVFKVGGPGAAGAAYGAKAGQRAVFGGVGAFNARRSFDGGAPRLRAPGPALPLGALGTGAGVAAGGS